MKGKDYDHEVTSPATHSLTTTTHTRHLRWFIFIFVEHIAIYQLFAWMLIPAAANYRVAYHGIESKLPQITSTTLRTCEQWQNNPRMAIGIVAIELAMLMLLRCAHPQIARRINRLVVAAAIIVLGFALFALYLPVVTMAAELAAAG